MKRPSRSSEQALSPEQVFADTSWLGTLARSLVADPELAEDLAQEAWLARLRRSGGSREISRPRAWMRRVLLSKDANRRRDEARRVEREERSARDEVLPSTAELCERAELQRILGEGMLALEEPFRTTVLLRFLEGLTPEEIARRTGVPANTVRWRLRRGIGILRERLERELGKDGRDWLLALAPFAERAGDGIAAGSAGSSAAAGASVSGAAQALSIGGLVLGHKAWVTVAAGGLIAVLAWQGMRDEAEPIAAELPAPAKVVLAQPAIVEAELQPRSAMLSGADPDRRKALDVADPVEEAPTVATENARVLFRSLGRETGEPLPGVSLVIEGTDGSFDGSAIQELRSDEDGLLPVELPGGLRYHVQAFGVEPKCGLVTMDIGPFEAGEESTVELSHPVALDIRFYGRFVDADTGEPLPGVEVQSTQPTEVEGVIEHAVSDGEGLFELLVPSWLYVWFKAEGPDHGRVTIKAVAGHGEPESAQVLPLSRAGAIHGFVRDAAGAPLAGARIVCSAREADLSVPMDRQRGPWGEIEWPGVVDGEGRYRIEGLPSRVKLTAHLVSAEGQKLRQKAELIELAPGEEQSIDWSQGAGANLSGIVRDLDGEPLEGVDLWLTNPPWNIERRFYPGDERFVTHAAVTGGEGRFRMKNVEPGTYSLGPRPSETGINSRMAPWPRIVEVEEGASEVQVELAVALDLAIRGQVVRSDGDPAANMNVRLDSEDGTFHAQADGEGLFLANGLRPGTYELTAGGLGDVHARSDKVVVEAGSEGVELVVRPGGEIRGHVLDDVGHAVRGTDGGMVLIAARTPPNDLDDWSYSGVRITGYYQLGGLAPGLYDASLVLEDGRVAVELGIDVPEGEAVDVDLRLEQGGKLELSVGEDAPESWNPYELYFEGALLHYGALEPGKSTTHVVPVGEVEVRYVHLEKEDVVGWVPIEVGETSGYRLER